MDLQTIFYGTGIVFMLVVLILLIGIGIATFLLVQKVHEVIATVSKQAKIVLHAVSHPGDIVRDVGESLARTILKKAQVTIKNFRNRTS